MLPPPPLPYVQRSSYRPRYPSLASSGLLEIEHQHIEHQHSSYTRSPLAIDRRTPNYVNTWRSKSHLLRRGNRTIRYDLFKSGITRTSPNVYSHTISRPTRLRFSTIFLRPAPRSWNFIYQASKATNSGLVRNRQLNFVLPLYSSPPIRTTSSSHVSY
jgi:hypothetical protein